MRVEPAEWVGVGRRHHKTRSQVSAMLEGIEVGQCVRVFHNDVTCSNGRCVLQSAISRMHRRYPGRRYQSYHEAQYIALVMRVN